MKECDILGVKTYSDPSRPVATFRHEEAVASSFLVVFGPDWPLLFKVHEI